MNPFVEALERAEKVIGKFYDALHRIELITRDPALDDAEKISQIKKHVEAARRGEDDGLTSGCV